MHSQLLALLIFLLTGPHSTEVVRSRKDELMDMKKKTKMLINQKLGM